MDEPRSAVILAPALAEMVKRLNELTRNDAGLRKLQSQNAPRAAAFGQGTLTDAAVVMIPEADGSRVFYALAVMFQDSAGRARYMINGSAPSKGGVGLPIPAGGGQIGIVGDDNIRQFRMIAETGATLDYAYQLFT